MYTMQKWAEDGSLKIAVGELVADEVGRRTRKDSALEFAKQCVRDQIEGEVEFKWNVMREIYRFA